MNPLAQYLMALAAVIGCYSCYVRFAVPVIEGPPNQIQRVAVAPMPELPSEEEQKSHLVPLLPRDAWELSSCKTLLTSTGTILFRDFKQLENGSMRVAPFTLITGLAKTKPAPMALPLAIGKSKKKTPTVLRCVEGAILKFDKPMREVLAGGEAKMQSARLTGQVDIYRPPSGIGKNDAMHVLTSNVKIDQQQIYTIDNVMFSFGANQGSGRNLLINLAHENDSSTPNDFSTINGIKRLELAFLDKLRIEPSRESNSMALPQGATGKNSKGNKKGKLLSNADSPLEIACKGPFVFDLESNTATFQDDVVATQVDAFQDNIKCEKLTLMFEELKSDEPNQDAKSGVELKRFIAEGSPAVVMSNSRSARITGEYLSYNVLENLIEASCSDNTAQNVTLVSPDYQMVSKRLIYVVPDDGSLGSINATGAGRLLRVATADQDEFFATWQKSLTTSDVADQPGLQRVLIDGDAKIRLKSQEQTTLETGNNIPDETRVNADQLEVLVWQVPVIIQNPDGKTKQGWEYHPAKLFTTGHVTIASPTLDGIAEELTATWPAPSPTRAATKPLSQIQSNLDSNHGSHRVAYRGTLQLVQPRSFGKSPQSEETVRPVNFEEAASGIRAIKPASKKKPKTKIKFKGNSVDVQLIGTSKDSQIRDLTIVGNVSIVEIPLEPNADPTAQPFQITGERLRLTPQDATGNYRALVSGSANKLAKVLATDFELAGQNINLNQAANKIWVEGSGTMKLTPSSKPKKTGEQSYPIGQAVINQVKRKTPGRLNVAWQGGMIFDGDKIYFENAVQMETDRVDKKGQKTKLKSESQALSVELKQPVDLTQLTGSQRIGDVDMREIIFVDRLLPSKQVFKLAAQSTISNQPRPVVVETQIFDVGNKLSEQQRISVPSATFNTDTGSLRATGPGSVATHRVSNGQDGNPFARLNRTPKTANRAPNTAKPKTGISFIRINFDNEMEIDSQRKKMEIDGRVRSVYSPVQTWDQTFDPDQTASLAPGGVYLTCEHLQLAQWSPRNNTKPTSEMIATGNAHIKSDILESVSDRVSYNEQSDTLTLDGTARSDAKLWIKKTPTDKNPSPVSAEKFSHRISEQRTEILKLSNGSYEGNSKK